MLLVCGSHLHGRVLEDPSPLEQISFASFLDHRLHPPTSEEVFPKAQTISIGTKSLDLLKTKLEHLPYQGEKQ